MTFLDLARLIRHYWIAVVAASLVCALTAFGVSAVIVSPKYEATATLTSTDPSGNVTADVLMSTVTPLAQQIAAEAPESVTITVKGPKSGATAAELRVLTFSAEGGDADECVAAVNAAAQETADRVEAIFLELEENQSLKREGAREILGEIGGDDPKTEALLEAIIIDREYSHCAFIVDEATQAEKGGVSAPKLALIALLGGLVLSVVVIIVSDLVKRPIKTREEIEAYSGLPVLSWPAAAGEGQMLWANLSVKFDGGLSDIAMLPLSAGGSLGNADALCAAAKDCGSDASADPMENAGLAQIESEGADGLKVVACQPIECDASSVYCVRRADAVVLCVRLWKDGLDKLDDVLKELDAVDVRPVGVALLADR